MHRLRRYWSYCFLFGVKNSCLIFIAQIARKCLGEKALAVYQTPKRMLVNGVSILIRPGTSDPAVVHQIFHRSEYADIPLREPKTIVDCGANIGVASLYFLNKFPRVRVVAVEPDSGNFAVCSKNLAPYQDRVSLVSAGIWSHSTGLVVHKGDFGDGQEWARQVREARPGETADVIGIGLQALLDQEHIQEVDLLKVDIERSEIVVFGSDTSGWLPRVRNIAIELHGSEADDIFSRALDGYQFDRSSSGELTICINMRPHRSKDLPITFMKELD